jgi:hypothetical protein
MGFMADEPTVAANVLQRLIGQSRFQPLAQGGAGGVGAEEPCVVVIAKSGGLKGE